MRKGEGPRNEMCLSNDTKKNHLITGEARHCPCCSTDQGVSRVRPVELDAHVELGGGQAAQHQLLPRSQPALRWGQSEIVDLVSCGKRQGRHGTQSAAHCSPGEAHSVHPLPSVSSPTQQNQTKRSRLRCCDSFLTDHRHDVQRRLEGLVPNAGLAGHDAGEADQVTGNDETLPGVPLGLLTVRMELLV